MQVMLLFCCIWLKNSFNISSRYCLQKKGNISHFFKLLKIEYCSQITRGYIEFMKKFIPFAPIYLQSINPPSICSLKFLCFSRFYGKMCSNNMKGEL